MLATTYDSQDPTSWWMSEKYDGIRAYWNGTQFVSRNLKPLLIPKEIEQKMPKGIALDGEIWFGKNTLSESMKLAQRAHNIAWDKFQFMIFDAPKYKGVFEGKSDVICCLTTCRSFSISEANNR
jgi:DNA ligase-1